MSEFEVVVGAGSLRLEGTDVVRFPHQWTEAGVTVQSQFTGAHVLHLAVAGCVLNDVYREAERAKLAISGVRVSASGGFDTNVWASTGIDYLVQVDSDASETELAMLLARVDEVAEIPRALRQGPAVRRLA